VPGIVGLGKAAEIALTHMAENSRRLDRLRNRLEEGLLARIPNARVNCQGSPRVPNTSNLMLPETDSESLVIALDLAGVACSAGAACSSGAVDASHVLQAIGFSAAEARSSIRLSLGYTTTEQDIDLAVERISIAVQRQRQAQLPRSEMVQTR